MIVWKRLNFAELAFYVFHLQDLFTSADIDYTDYIRTTEDRHVAVVETFWVSTFAMLLQLHSAN